MKYNFCRDCGKELNNSRAKLCNPCKERLNKRELDNREILTKYQSSLDSLKKTINKLGIKIDEELKRLSSLKDKFILNESNKQLLNQKMKQLVTFKENLIEEWVQDLLPEEKRKEDELNFYFDKS